LSDKQFVDVGDELVVRIAGYPVAKAIVKRINDEEGVVVLVGGKVIYDLPLNFTEYGDAEDGVTHRPENPPLGGQVEPHKAVHPVIRPMTNE
jgi:hypothetical protein